MRDCRNRGMQIIPEIKRASICSWLWSACLLFLCIDCGQIGLAIRGKAFEIIISSCKGKLRIRNIIAYLPWENFVKIHERKGNEMTCIILPAIDYSFIRICIWVNGNQREDFDLLALTWGLFQEKFLGGLNILWLRLSKRARNWIC